jgi:hypothetical protein
MNDARHDIRCIGRGLSISGADPRQGVACLTIHCITDAELARILSFLRDTASFAPLPPRAEEEIDRARVRALRRGQLHAGGRGRGITHHADFPLVLVNAVREHLDEFDRDPGPSAVAKTIGTSYRSLHRWLTVRRLEWADVVLVANPSFGSLWQSADHLAAIERVRTSAYRRPKGREDAHHRRSAP